MGSPLSWLVLAISIFRGCGAQLAGAAVQEVGVPNSAASNAHFVSRDVYGLVPIQAQFTPALWALLGELFM